MAQGLFDSLSLSKGIATLILMLYCAIIIGINWLIRKNTKKRITSSKSAEESVLHRENYRKVRIIIIVLHTAILIWLFYHTIGLLLSGNDSITQKCITFCIIAMVIISYGSMSLPISSMTIDKFNPDKDFALYLRGFDSDSYEMSHGLTESVDFLINPSQPKKQNPNHTPFSEEYFCKAIKKYMPIYSIGMTKEVDSPHGSHRIYLNDETWKEDVSELISKAKLVFIRLHNSESCIWEILQCEKNASEKTLYFIDSLLVYKRIAEKMKGNFPVILHNQYDNILEIGYQARIKYLDPAYLNLEETEELENFYKLIDSMKENKERFISENFDEEVQNIEEEFLDKKAKLHLLVFNDGIENKILEYSNTEEGYKIMLRTIFANKEP